MPHADVEGQLPLPPVTFHVLMALVERRRHGYGIIQDVEARTDGAVELQPGTLYRTLQRLLERGLIEETSAGTIRELDDPRRRYYRITTFGTEVARAEAYRLTRLVGLARASGLLPEAT